MKTLAQKIEDLDTARRKRLRPALPRLLLRK
jgi:hypothetical protein